MQEEGKSREQLEAAVRQLQEDLAEKKRALLTLQARDLGYRRLFNRLSQHLFTIGYENGRPVRFESLPAAGDAAGEAGLPDALSEQLAVEKGRMALDSGKAVEYVDEQEGGDGMQAWRVVLVPEEATGAVGQTLLGLAAETVRQPAAEVGLQPLDELYHRLISLLPQAVGILDGEGRFIYANPDALHLLGAGDLSDLVGRPLSTLLVEGDAARFAACLELLREGRRIERSEQQVRRLDHEVIVAEVVAVPIRYQNQFAILTTARDLTGRRRMEAALAETQDLFYRAFQHAPVAISISRLSDGVFIDVNEQFSQLTGHAREEIIGSSVFKLQLLEDRQERKQLVDALREHGAVHNAEVRLRSREGQLRVVLVTVQLITVRGIECMLTISQDITEQKRAAVADQENRALLYKIFHASPSAICIIRLRDECFVDLNERFCQLLGYDREDILSHPASAFGLSASTTGDARLEGIFSAKEDALQDIELEVPVRSGEVRTVLGSFQRIQVKGEACVLVVLSDITERKQSERRLVEAKERAEEMARLKSAFLTNMTHEFRTPLTVILGFTSMLRQGVSREYQRFVHLIERSGRRLLLMLDSILDLAQLEAGTLEVEGNPYNILDVVVGVTSALQPVADEKGLTFSVVLPEQPIYARLDHAVLTRVLNNLLDNAIKFTEAGDIQLGVDADPQNVYLKIRDTGVGIDEAFLPHIFEEFSQESTGLERTHQGSGLGLAVSKRLVELIGGSIEVESSKGQGSLFTIVFPRAPAAEPG